MVHPGPSNDVDVHDDHGNDDDDDATAANDDDGVDDGMCDNCNDNETMIMKRHNNSCSHSHAFLLFLFPV